MNLGSRIPRKQGISATVQEQPGNDKHVSTSRACVRGFPTAQKKTPAGATSRISLEATPPRETGPCRESVGGSGRGGVTAAVEVLRKSSRDGRSDARWTISEMEPRWNGFERMNYST